MTFADFRAQLAPDLNEQQAAAVETHRGPVLLLAVPGSGKTTALVTRIACLIYVYGVHPSNILTMTYTVASSKDMRERFAARFGDELAAQLAFRTINGLCHTVIRQYERMLGRQAFSLLEPGPQAALMGQLCREQTGEFANENTVKALQTAITYIKNSMTDPEDFDDGELEGVEFPALYRRYNQVLREQCRMDYDDQLVYAFQILKRYPAVLEVFRTQYPYILVDEAQDTSRIQHAILDLLAGPGGNLFLVGDEDQSIYGFRAADPSALVHFEDTHPGAKILFLEQNYRSLPDLVRVANRFIAQNKSRRDKNMAAVRDGGAILKAITVADRDSQYAPLLELAAELPSDTAVLYRDNDSALPLIDRLERQGLPYRCRQVDCGFFTHRILRDVTDIIHLSQDPEGGDAFLRIYFKLGAGISKQNAEAAVRACRGTGTLPVSYLADSNLGSQWMRRQCRNLAVHWESLATDDGETAIRRIQNAMGYGDYLTQRGADTGKLDILASLGSAEPSAPALLQRLAVLREIIRQGGGERGLILSTIHSSKGLEYDRVILLDVADGLLPRLPRENQSEAQAAADLEEERRLFYVAMTRAKNELDVFRFRSADLASSFSEELFAPDDSQYQAGVAVHHLIYGPGTVTDRQGGIVSVTFTTGETRRFLLSAALQARQLAVRAS